ncbi:MAG: hypothetical protein FJ186_01815 [Gammaproteobacteria bacterium]|jgi:hypothetical protein|nr:hypothetical protein [Gammaproteobacteria bacterium]
MADMPQGSWRDSARPAKFFIFNYVTVFPVLWFLFNLSWMNLFIIIFVISVLMILDYYGLPPHIFARFLRGVISGRRKISSPWWV